jgi:uncharacterized membrane protein
MSAVDVAGTPATGPDGGLKLVVPGRSLPAGAGWDWIVAGWKLFARAPLMWILALVIVFVIAFIMNIVPIIGSLAFQLLQGVFAAGFVLGCRSLETGGEFEIEHVFAGFKRNLSGLILLGVFVLIGWLIVFAVFAGFVGFSVLGAVLTGNSDTVLANAATAGMGILLGLLVMLALMIPLLAAYWFAPALVVMHNMPPLAAMGASLSACMRNFLPFVIVWGIVMSVLGILAAIPLGLGLLVWVPVMITSSYVAYRQIFTEEAPGA